MEAKMSHERHGAQPAMRPTGGLTDPVCGMSVPPTSPHRYRLGTTEFAFCSARCRERFAGDPRAFLPGSAPLPAKAPPKAHEEAETYACPMHPDIRQAGPGTCTKCGMALEPVAPRPKPLPTEWVCPMHREIARDAPGSCPICGSRVPGARPRDTGLPVVGVDVLRARGCAQ
jgi:Cu+-exporting ATPase